jgi:hypothetical protein
MMAGGVMGMTLGSLGPVAAQQSGHSPFMITVNNTRDVPAVVYLQRDVMETRLGTVPAQSTTILNLPTYLQRGEEIRVFVHPEGGMDLSTGEEPLRVGETLSIVVPTNNTGYVRELPPEVIPNPGDETTTVTVNNLRDARVTVFLESGDFDYRIGTVPATQERTLYLPKSLVEQHESVEIFVHPEGGLDLASETFQMNPGAHMFIRVPPK